MLLDLSGSIRLLGASIAFGGGAPDAGYLGVFTDEAALNLAHPTAPTGSTATVTNPSGNLFYYDGAAWVDTGTGSSGDMLKAVYDPTAQNADAFSMGSMVETVGEKVLTSAERTAIAANTVTRSQPGDGRMIFHDTVPSGWLLCDGSVVLQATYPALFAVLGTTWNTGGEGGTEFRLPDMRERSPIGKNTATTAIDSVGKTGGAFDHTHDVDPPSTTTTGPSDTSQNSDGLFAGTASPSAAHDHDVDIAAVTSSSANGPFATVNWIVKT